MNTRRSKLSMNGLLHSGPQNCQTWTRRATASEIFNSRKEAWDQAMKYQEEIHLLEDGHYDLILENEILNREVQNAEDEDDSI